MRIVLYYDKLVGIADIKDGVASIQISTFVFSGSLFYKNKLSKLINDPAHATFNILQKRMKKVQTILDVNNPKAFEELLASNKKKGR